MRGPIDYIVVSFDGNQFKGEILNELEKAVSAGTISVLALSLVTKDADGSVMAINLDEGGISFAISQALHNELIDDKDIAEVGELLEPNTAAGLLIVEHTWAIGLKQAITNANGRLVTDGRIHPDAALEIESILGEEK